MPKLTGYLRALARSRRIPPGIIAIILLTLALSLTLPQAARAWPSAGNLQVARQEHTATLLQNGKVLVVGGWGSSSALASCELYDPTKKSDDPTTWSLTGKMAYDRTAHTATLLQNGKVLVVGGYDASNGVLNTAELYDPAAGTWSSAGTFTDARQRHTATLLPDGRVLVVGGTGSGGESLQSALLYTPDSGTGSWGSAGTLTTARGWHTAALMQNGTVLVAGGQSAPGTFTSTSQIYTPNAGAGTWSSESSFATARMRHTATVLTDGRMLLAGGEAGPNPLTYPTNAQIYSGGWGGSTTMPTGRELHTATLLPNGKLLLAGGYNGTWVASVDVYNGSSWESAGSLATPRMYHSATLLPNGKVLVAGGRNSSGVSIASCEFYDYAAGSWAAATNTLGYTVEHTLTLLPDGRVLRAGGNSGMLTDSDIYNPTTNSWSTAPAMGRERCRHTATLLTTGPNAGKVLVAGGDDYLGGSSYETLSTCELFDPVSNTWSPTGSMAAPRQLHQAVLLANGKVLVVGGSTSRSTSVGMTKTAEIYDPANGTWSPTGSLNVARYWYTNAGQMATLLPNGKVLVVGGIPDVVTSCELFDPTANNGVGAWSYTGNLNVSRNNNYPGLCRSKRWKST
jgi:N-acetylneuraminic acid mutarotase